MALPRREARARDGREDAYNVAVPPGFAEAVKFA